MKIKQKVGFLFIGALLLAIGIGYSSTQRPSPAPESEFKTIKGETISLAQLRGKPVLVTFWASDCLSCLEEIPDLISLHQQYRASGLAVISVAMYYDPPNQVLETAAAKQLPYAVALDPTAVLAKAFGEVQFTPTTFLIDRNGKIAMKTTGKFELATIRERLDKL